MHLAQLQNDFQAFLIDKNKADAFKSQIVDDAKVGAIKRLSIYYDAYRFRIIEALSTAYPKLHVMLGDHLFDQTARSYIEQFPSTHRNMRWVGGHMQTHLKNTVPQHPIAEEMAAFEWALGLAFDAEDSPILTMQDLVGVPPQDWVNLTFQFHSSCHLLLLQYNVVQIWNALDKKETPPTILQTNVACIIWRMDLNAHFRSLDTTEHEALQSTVEGASFGGLCEQLQENMSDEAATTQAAQYLAGWLNDGLITKV